MKSYFRQLYHGTYKPFAHDFHVAFVKGRISICQTLPPQLNDVLSRHDVKIARRDAFRNGCHIIIGDDDYPLDKDDIITRMKNVAEVEFQNSKYDLTPNELEEIKIERYVNGKTDKRPSMKYQRLIDIDVLRYRNGFDVKWFEISESDVYARYGNGNSDVKYDGDAYMAHASHYENGGELHTAPNNIEEYRKMNRIIGGYHMRDFPDFLPNKSVLIDRIRSGYDPDMTRDYLLSYRLGYRLPDKIRLELTDDDRRVHADYELNKICILALSEEDMFPVIPRDKSADFNYATGLSTPQYLEIFDTSGARVFRTHDLGESGDSGESCYPNCGKTGRETEECYPDCGKLAYKELRDNQVRVWQLFDHHRLTNPRWEDYLAADLVGTLVVRPMKFAELAEWRRKQGEWESETLPKLRQSQIEQEAERQRKQAELETDWKAEWSKQSTTYYRPPRGVFGRMLDRWRGR